MKLSFATLGCPDWTLEQIAERAAALGYDAVELRGVAGEHLGPDESPARLAEIKARFADAGVEIAAIIGYTRFASPDPEERQASADHAARFIDVAAALDCSVLRIFGGDFPGEEDAVAVERIADAVKLVAGRAAGAGVRLALETHDAWCAGARVKQLVEAVDSKGFGVCWDAANSCHLEPVATTYAAIGGHIVHVHLKDVKPQPTGEFSIVLPGTGAVPFQEVLVLLRDGGYAGALSFEWEKKWHPELVEPEVAFPLYHQYVSQLMQELSISRA